MATLRVVSGPAAGQTLQLEGEMIIGREGDGLAIPDKEISRRHTAVRETERGVEVEDLGSMNGTFVDGRRITEPVTLTIGGTIELGSSQIRVELPPTAATRVAAAPVATPATTRVAATPPPAAPPPAETAAEAPAAEAPPPGPSGPRRSRVPVVLGLLALLVAAGVAAALLLGGDSEEETTPHAFKGRAAAALVTEPALELTAAGFYQGRPFGRAGALIDRTVPEPNLPGGPAVPLTLKLAFSNVKGQINATFKGNIKLTRRGVEIVRGRARITKGTGEFEGATGSFELRGDNVQQNPISRFTLDGTVEY
jgi:pSer/pThr/pTyr-binding forkhead associated (FHA) protein